MSNFKFDKFDFVEDAAVIFRDTFVAIEESLDTDEEKAEAYFLVIYNYLTDTLRRSENKHVNGIVTMCRSGQIGTAKRHKIAKENGAKGGAPKKYDDEQIVKLKLNGYTNKQIRDELGCGDSKIQDVMRKYRSKSGNLSADQLDSSIEEAVITSDNLKTNTNTNTEIKKETKKETKTRVESKTEDENNSDDDIIWGGEMPIISAISTIRPTDYIYGLC